MCAGSVAPCACRGSHAQESLREEAPTGFGNLVAPTQSSGRLGKSFERTLIANALGRKSGRLPRHKGRDYLGDFLWVRRAPRHHEINFDHIGEAKVIRKDLRNMLGGD
jgi:hypothetical protein